MADFAAANGPFLRRFMRPEHGPPSRDVFSWLFLRMDLDPFVAALSRFAPGAGIVLGQIAPERKTFRIVTRDTPRFRLIPLIERPSR